MNKIHLLGYGAMALPMPNSFWFHCYPATLLLFFGHFSPQLMWLQPIINIIKHYKAIYDILKPICWNSTTKHEAYHHFTWHYITIPPKRYLITNSRHAEPLAPISPCRGSWRLRPIPLLALPPQTAGRRGRGRRTGARGDPRRPRRRPRRRRTQRRRSGRRWWRDGWFLPIWGWSWTLSNAGEERDFWERRRNGTNGTRSERNGRSAWEEDSVMIWRGRFSLAMPWLTSMICPLVCKLIVYFWFPLLLSECPISKIPHFFGEKSHTSSREC